VTTDPCKGAEHQLQPYLDRVLTSEELTRLEQHLACCAYCNERYTFEAHLRDTVRRCCASTPVPDDLVERLRLRLVQR
jgi:anti-sigma factor (TIGR02949 family)